MADKTFIQKRRSPLWICSLAFLLTLSLLFAGRGIHRGLLRDRMLKEAEHRVNDLEDKRASLEELLCDPEVFLDHEKARKISEELEEVKAELDEAYMDWLELQGE